VALRTEIRQTVEMCRHCFMCRHANPTFLVTKLDAHTPRGYALALSRIDDGLVAWTEDVVSKLYQSTLDGLCSELCEFDWREDLVVQAGREEAVRQGLAPPAVIRAADRRIGDGADGTASVRLPVAAERLDRVGADLLFVTGLEARERCPGTIAATAALLDHFGADWTIPSVEHDPGIDLWELGYSEAALRAAERFAAQVVRLRPSRIVTGSSRVLRALREPLPSAALASLPQAGHLSEFLADRLAARGATVAPAVRADADRIAYHDPCSLGRRARVFEPPRQVIQALDGAPPIEFSHSRAIAECCGEGGVLPEVDPELAARLASATLARLPEGVTMLLTACPGCRAQLGAAAERAGGKVAVMDISELAARRLGLRWAADA
jgi:Fe-S oxidoreductase